MLERFELNSPSSLRSLRNECSCCWFCGAGVSVMASSFFSVVWRPSASMQLPGYSTEVLRNWHLMNLSQEPLFCRWLNISSRFQRCSASAASCNHYAINVAISVECLRVYMHCVLKNGRGRCHTNGQPCILIQPSMDIYYEIWPGQFVQLDLLVIPRKHLIG